jgi:hypothetical protein
MSDQASQIGTPAASSPLMSHVPCSYKYTYKDEISLPKEGVSPKARSLGGGREQSLLIEERIKR